MSVIFISENRLLQNMLKRACEAENDLNVITYETVEDIPKTADSLIVLLHITLSLTEAATQINALLARQDLANVRIVLLVRPKLADAIRLEFASYAQAIIPENSDIETLISGLTLVQHGYRITQDDSPPNSARKKATPSLSSLNDIKGVEFAKSSKEALLSKRERAILARLSQGGSNKDIAKDLGIQESTVKVHLRACYRKIGARNRTQAAVWAAERLSS